VEGIYSSKKRMGRKAVPSLMRGYERGGGNCRWLEPTLCSSINESTKGQTGLGRGGRTAALQNRHTTLEEGKWRKMKRTAWLR